MKKNKKKSGFTLFELLVSISIIAVLTAVAVVSFGGLNIKTRDARRTSDLEKIRLTLEAARQIGNTYPSSLTSLVGSSLLDKVPTDPKTGGTYPYTATNYTYYLCAFVEDIGSTSSNVSGCSGLPSGYAGYLKVVNP
jgi:prepilin-type N-terminal cleavage/methylation domain-containing protein